MKLSSVTEKDGLHIAYLFQYLNLAEKLINGLGNAGIEFQGIEKYNDTKLYLSDMANEMARQLRATKEVEEKKLAPVKSKKATIKKPVAKKKATAKKKK